MNHLAHEARPFRHAARLVHDQVQVLGVAMLIADAEGRLYVIAGHEQRLLGLYTADATADQIEEDLEYEFSQRPTRRVHHQPKAKETTR